MRKRLAGLALPLAFLTGCGTPGLLTGASDARFDASAKGGKEWTVFVYMAADNSLTEAADLDLNEMEAGLSSDRVRFVVLVDQAKQGDSRILEIQPDAKGMNEMLVSRVVDDKGAVIPASREVNTGSPETLKRFLDWGTKQFPSRRSMLVMWNHGGAAFSDPDHLKSFCWDDTSKSHLTLVDLWRTAQHLATRTKFDVTGFDTCLLGHLETAFQFKRVSSFLVSSERVSPGYGWDYQALARTLSRKPDIYPRELATAIAKDYQAFYQKEGEKTTISVTDLEKVGDRLVPAVNALAKNLTGVVQTSTTRPALTDTMIQALGGASGSGEGNAIDLGYFGDLLQQNPKLPPETRNLAAKMTQELRRSVVTNLTTDLPAGKYQGLKVYFSWRYNKMYADPSHQFFGTQAWTDFLKAYDKAPSPGNSTPNPFPNPSFPSPGLPPM